LTNKTRFAFLKNQKTIWNKLTPYQQVTKKVKNGLLTGLPPVNYRPVPQGMFPVVAREAIGSPIFSFAAKSFAPIVAGTVAQSINEG
jgi:hypothetical protein